MNFIICKLRLKKSDLNKKERKEKQKEEEGGRRGKDGKITSPGAQVADTENTEASLIITVAETAGQEDKDSWTGTVA